LHKGLGFGFLKNFNYSGVHLPGSCEGVIGAKMFSMPNILLTGESGFLAFWKVKLGSYKNLKPET